MWKILLAELNYYKWRLLVVFGMLCVLGMSFIQFQWGNLTQFTIGTVVILFITTGILGSDSDQEKRDRLNKLLPGSLSSQSAARSLFLILIVIGMYTMWIPYSLFNPQETFGQALLIMATWGDIYLIVILSFCIFQDLGHLSKSYYRFVFLGFVLLSLILLILYIGSRFTENGPKLILTPVHALVLNLLAAAMLYADHIIFIRRKTYVE